MKRVPTIDIIPIDEVSDTGRPDFRSINRCS